MKCRHADHEGKTCFQNGLMIGDVSQAHLDLMLEVRKAMFDTFTLIQRLVPENKGSCHPRKPSSSQQDAHRAPAQVELTPREHSQKKGSNAVAICIKIWLEVRTSILSQNDAYSRISRQNLV
jgi:hypothetical protein